MWLLQFLKYIKVNKSGLPSVTEISYLVRIFKWKYGSTYWLLKIRKIDFSIFIFNFFKLTHVSICQNLRLVGHFLVYFRGERHFSSNIDDVVFIFLLTGHTLNFNQSRHCIGFSPWSMFTSMTMMTNGLAFGAPRILIIIYRLKPNIVFWKVCYYNW